MDLGDLRGIGTILCMLGFFAVVAWAYAPSHKDRFEADANLPFAEDIESSGESK